MLNNENILTKISEEYYLLTASEKKVADFVMTHQMQVQYMSISEFAEQSGVADATVTRFTRRMGCKGYAAFKLELAYATNTKGGPSNILSGEIYQSDDFETLCSKLLSVNTYAMHQTMEGLRDEDIEMALELFRRADRVLCMGQGGSVIMAAVAAHLFSTVSNKFFPIVDSHMQAISIANCSEKDVIFYFSYSGATKELLYNLSVARERGIKTVLVTHFVKSPGAQLSDAILPCGASETPQQNGSVGAKIAQLYLLDVLFTKYYLKNMEECNDRCNRVADIMSDMQV